MVSIMYNKRVKIFNANRDNVSTTIGSLIM